MIKITVDRTKENPCEIEADAANFDELRDDIITIAYNLIGGIAQNHRERRTTDNNAELLQRVTLAKNMLEMGAQAAIDEIASNEDPGFEILI